jgi:hypothetical protein
MPDKFKLLQLPTQPLQKNIPLEITMAREIEREHVTNELLKVKFEEAGYEIVLEESGDLSIMRTAVNLRLSNFNEHASIRLRGHMILNNQLSDEELDKFVKEVNYDSYSIRFIGHRWDDGDIGLFGNYVIYYPFGLNLPNLIFTVRQFVDAMRAIFEEHKSAGKYFPETN